MYETSDDDGNTISVASADARGSDDLSSFGDIDEDGFRSDDSDSSEEDPFETTPQVSYHPDAASGRPHTPGSDDGLEASTADLQDQPRVWEERSDAPWTNGTAAVEVCRVVSEFHGRSSTSPVLKQFGYPDLRTVVKMPLKRDWLPITPSYRVLYIGPMVPWLVEEINSHIGAALSATPSSSRFHIFQNFARTGSPSSSGVQLERAGSELIVDHCPIPSVECTEGKIPSATVTLNDGSQITFSVNGTIGPESASLPDLIIFGYPGPYAEGDHAEIDFAVRHTRIMIHLHGLPALDVTVVPDYLGPGLPFQFGSLKMCLQGRRNKDQEYEPVKVLPVDHTAFMSVEPEHLNMHLAYLKERSEQERGPAMRRRRGKSILTKIRERVDLDLNLNRMVNAINYRDIAVLLFALVLGVLVIEAGLWSMSYRHNLISTTLSSNLPSSLSSPSTMALKPASVTKPPSVAPSLNISKDLTVLPTKQPSRMNWRNLVNRTKEETVGKSTIGSNSSDQCVVRRLETMSEQMLEKFRRLESISDQVASQWSKEIMRQIRKGSDQASQFTRYCTDRVREKTQPLRAASYKEETLRRVQESSQKANELRRYYANRVWEETRPLRTSSYMLNARERSLQLRCNVETRLGIRNSRSCKLLEDGQPPAKKR